MYVYIQFEPGLRTFEFYDPNENCNCGADRINATIDAIIKEIEESR